MPNKLPDVGLIIPTYGKFAYARRAIRSALKYSHHRLVILVVDDASPNWASSQIEEMAEKEPRPDDILIYRFTENGGLTRSWNYGLKYLAYLGCDYICCANSDVVFTESWDVPLAKAIDRGYSLVGPLSNNPGVTNPKNQQIDYFYQNYKLSDDPADLAKVSEDLKKMYPGQIRDTNVNGFCLFSSAQTWWDYAYDEDHVFNPKHKMTFNEDELQRRWRGKLKLKTGACMDSFVFHYRAVSRGGRAKTGKWLRTQDPDRPV